MTLLAFLVGIVFPGILGWFTIVLLEDRHPVLGRWERLLVALSLGPTLLMLIVFIGHSLGLLSITFFGFLLPLIVFTCIAASLSWWRGLLTGIAAERELFIPAEGLPRWMRLGLIVLLCWTALKIVAGGFDLVTTPTYWDDSFNNWNLRGKMFFVDERLSYAVPRGFSGETDEGIGAYPVAVPLQKAWLASLKGSWSDGLVNSIHAVEFLLVLGLLFTSLRRYVGLWTSTLGVYVLASLPLFLIHGVNPYAEMVLALHLLLAVSALFHAAMAENAASRRTWLKLSAFALGLSVFTKNEAVVLYLPLILMLAAWLLSQWKGTGKITQRELGRVVAITVFIVAVLALPWLSFKWLNGFTFGNAKSISGVALSFHKDALYAIWYHFSHEANWLFLPLLFPLLVLVSGRVAWRLPFGLLTIFLLVMIVSQMSIFVFTSIATEAVRQTGVSRGIVQLAPIAVMLFVLLVQRLYRRLSS